MSLSKFAGVHPWVQERVRAILDIADRYGGRYTVTSGVRTKAAQQTLYFDRKTNTPPGCSQHEYGLAMDVQFQAPLQAAWQDYYQQGARYLGLTTVPGDDVHVQAFPGSFFRNWAVDARVCNPKMSLETREWRDCLLHSSRHTIGHQHSCRLPCGPVYGIPC